MFSIQCIFLICLSLQISGLPVKNSQTEFNIASVHEDTLIKNDTLTILIEDEEITQPKTEETNATSIAINNATSRNEYGRSIIRPGMAVTNYAVSITPDVGSGTFTGVLVATVNIVDVNTRENPMVFYIKDLDISSVRYAIAGGSTFTDTTFFFDNDDGFLEIDGVEATLYTLLIEYTGILDTTGNGMFYGSYGTNTYVAMNLYPTHARRVFPCLDELTQESTVSFTFNNIVNTVVVGNSITEQLDASTYQLTALQGPVHRWGMVAHDLLNINNPVIGTRLFVRSGVTGQDQQASVIINAIFTQLQEWTTKPYAEILDNQEGSMNIIALPDFNKDWVALSTVCIWEPHILMTTSHGPTQRKIAMENIAEAMTAQWFGYVVYPEDWRHQWINIGFGRHAAFEMLREWQGTALENDNSVIDINTIFVTDVIQESLYRDGYAIAEPLEAGQDLMEEDDIRGHINGLIKHKGPAMMWMLKSILGQTDADVSIDYVQAAARALLNSRSHQTFNIHNFYDAINSEWMSSSNKMIDDITEFLEPWILNANYPVLNVQMRTAGVIVSQERFAFRNVDQISYQIPITYTSSLNPNFDDVAPQAIMDNSLNIDMFLDEEDWVLFNIQGQGYYRVNYDVELWERLILAHEDPDLRNVIHPLNRATLIDDAFNLARAGKLDYDITFRLALTMELETEYAVWKAFLRNMKFLRRRLEAYVFDDEDLDPDIYLRMIRRTISAVESEITFYPDTLIIENAMTSITRGMVMEHACLAGYVPCIAAALDWFYDPNTSDLALNPNIPHDMRPAVYCSVVREGDETSRDILWAALAAENSYYERLLIVRGLACSRDESFLLGVLQDTISTGGEFTTEERVQFMVSMIESGHTGADLALRFLRLNTNAVRNMYGGSDKLEEIIFILSDNVGDADLTDTFDIWINSINSGLDESLDIALSAAAFAQEDLLWNTIYMDYVYEWIDENDAPTLTISLMLLFASLMFNYFNR